MADPAPVSNYDPNTPKLIAPGSEDQPPPGAIAAKMGLGGEGIRPTENEAWWMGVDLSSSNANFGTPQALGRFPRWIGEQIDSYVADQSNVHKLTADEANRQYNMESVGGTKFSEPLYPAVAQSRFRELQRQQSLKGLMSMAPSSGKWDDLTQSLTALAGSPLDLATGFLAGEGVGAVAKGLGIAATGLKGLANVYGQNLVGNILVQAPNYYLGKLENQQVSATEEAKSAAVNAALFTGLHYLLAPVFSRLSRTPIDLQNQTIREGIAQAESGQKINTSSTMEAMAARERGASQPGTEVPPINRAAPGTPVSEKAMYGATNPDTGQATDFNGRGAEYTDHPGEARNAASNPEGASKGTVTEGAISPDANLLDLDQSLKTPEAMDLAKKIEEKLGVDLRLSPDMTLKDVLDQLPVHGSPADLPHLQGAAQQIAEAAGFHGYTEAMPGNREAVTLFKPDEHFTPLAENPPLQGSPPRAEGAPSLDPSKSDPAKMENYRPDQEIKEKEIKEQLLKTPEAEAALVKEQDLNARRVLGDSPQVSEAVAKIDSEFKEDTKVKQAFKTFLGCFTKGIS